MVESFSLLKRKPNIDEWSIAPTFTAIYLCIIVLHILAALSSYKVILTLQGVPKNTKPKRPPLYYVFHVFKSKNYIAELCETTNLLSYCFFCTFTIIQILVLSKYRTIDQSQNILRKIR